MLLSGANTDPKGDDPAASAKEVSSPVAAKLGTAIPARETAREAAITIGREGMRIGMYSQ